MSAHWKSYPDPAAAAEACATHILSLLETALAGNSAATVAFSGGSTPRLMFEAMVRQRFDWSDVHVFFVDERTVPPDHPDSNYGLAEKHLIRPGHVPHRNVHRIHGELAPPQAARHCEHEVREFFALDADALPHFDVVHLGMGADGHTASLFPGEPLIEDREGIVAAVHVPKLNSWRVTLLPGVLLAARHVAVLVAGDDKAEALRDVFQGVYDPLKLPAQIVAHHSRRASWFVDSAAARLLDSGAVA
jgi:6-phosphogluconolactonase